MWAEAPCVSRVVAWPEGPARSPGSELAPDPAAAPPKPEVERIELPTALQRVLLNVRQVAALLKVSTATIYALVNSSTLRHCRVLNSIRIAPADLEAFLARFGERPGVR